MTAVSRVRRCMFSRPIMEILLLEFVLFHGPESIQFEKALQVDVFYPLELLLHDVTSHSPGLQELPARSLQMLNSLPRALHRISDACPLAQLPDEALDDVHRIQQVLMSKINL
eukprot:CAMPEP_0169285684 /NCGR_PEP_ID=MMETSP1016-20121227/58843_1 /TAXON_ID=342587 /ORGANISM="Karlodinium micrum, Strain CCMP2283" /LENGTH=112 /DNA_ID=CAMNT_0009375235 /DNA_START=259 /DNA_END=593 /DNA_ORIENTATION=-